MRLQVGKNLVFMRLSGRFTTTYNLIPIFKLKIDRGS